jgi:hypothetical protein
MTWAYVGLAAFGVLPVIVKAVLIYRARRDLARMSPEERTRWDDAVRGP